VIDKVPSSYLIARVAGGAGTQTVRLGNDNGSTSNLNENEIITATEAEAVLGNVVCEVTAFACPAASLACPVLIDCPPICRKVHDTCSMPEGLESAHGRQLNVQPPWLDGRPAGFWRSRALFGGLPP
jgi:hypothetical protein